MVFTGVGETRRHALIAMRLSGRDFPGRGALVMSTYAVGQYLLASGAVQKKEDAPPDVSRGPSVDRR